MVYIIQTHASSYISKIRTPFVDCSTKKEKAKNLAQGDTIKLWKLFNGLYGKLEE